MLLYFRSLQPFQPWLNNCRFFSNCCLLIFLLTAITLTCSEPFMESDSSNAITWIFVLEKVRHLVCQKKAQGYSKILPFKLVSYQGVRANTEWSHCTYSVTHSFILHHQVKSRWSLTFLLFLGCFNRVKVGQYITTWIRAEKNLKI